MPELSIVIPARCEEWLNLTVQDVLSHIEADTEIIVILDGEWPKEPLPQHERVQVVYLPESIGQRAATNLGAKISTAQYVMKLDAHVSVGPGFDRILIESAKELGDDVTQIPAQKNLHVYDRICGKCGRREYQGSPTAQCVTCGDTTWTLEVIWKPRGGTTTTAWSFTPEPKFQYDGAMGKRSTDEIQDVMTSLGACFFMSRQRFWDLDGLDESYGSWGSFGIEVACKSWLSGGRQVVNRRTHFAHFFRVGGVGFPYPISGAQQDHARKRAHDIWFNNAWPKQVRPLRWLVEKFWPVNRWSQEDLDALPKSLPANPIVSDADAASSESVLIVRRESVAAYAVSFPSIPSPFASEDVLGLADKSKVVRIAAGRVVADEVVKDKLTGRQIVNEPSVHQSVNHHWAVGNATEVDSSIAVFVPPSGPDPAMAVTVDGDLREQAGDEFCGESDVCERVGNSHDSASSAVSGLGPRRVSQHSRGPSSVSKAIVAYTDNRLDSEIAATCLSTIRASGLPFVVVSLKPVTGLTWDQNVVLNLERSVLTMFKQILIGLQEINADFVFFAEHDCAYHPSHFDFTPPNSSQAFYNQNVWKVDAETGQALHYLCSQTSGLCANRELLLEHYRKRVEIVEAKGFSRKMGFEPGTHRRAERVDDLTARTWMSEYPNVDIRHDKNLTPSRWTQDAFRDKRYCAGWTEADGVPGWGVTKGCFREFLREAVGAVQQAVA